MTFIIVTVIQIVNIVMTSLLAKSQQSELLYGRRLRPIINKLRMSYQHNPREEDSREISNDMTIITSIKNPSNLNRSSCEVLTIPGQESIAVLTEQLFDAKQSRLAS